MKYLKYFESKSNSHLFPQDWVSELDVEGDKVKLYHYGKKGLDYLDPEKFGKNRYTQSEMWWGLPRIYFYTDPDQKERMVSGELYEIEVDLKDLYPFNKDPLNLYDECSKELEMKNIPIRRQVICIGNKLKRMGYKGMVYKWHGGNLIAVIWERVSVDSKESEKPYDIPKSDYVGWKIKDGLSTDPRLDTREEKVKRVAQTMARADYPQSEIDTYLSNML